MFCLAKHGLDYILFLYGFLFGAIFAGSIWIAHSFNNDYQNKTKPRKGKIKLDHLTPHPKHIYRTSLDWLM